MRSALFHSKLYQLVNDFDILAYLRSLETNRKQFFLLVVTILVIHA